MVQGSNPQEKEHTKTKSNDFPSLPHGLQSRESEPKKPGSLAEKRKQHAEFDEQRWLGRQDAREKSNAKELKRVLLKSRVDPLCV